MGSQDDKFHKSDGLNAPAEFSGLMINSLQGMTKVMPHAHTLRNKKEQTGVRYKPIISVKDKASSMSREE